MKMNELVAKDIQDILDGSEGFPCEFCITDKTHCPKAKSRVGICPAYDLTRTASEYLEIHSQ